jgi:hypothetical protein
LHIDPDDGQLARELDPASFYLPTAEAALVTTTDGGRVVATQQWPSGGRPEKRSRSSAKCSAFAELLRRDRRNRPGSLLESSARRNHAFMLMSPSRSPDEFALPPLTERLLFTFHQEGLYRFACSRHPNAMFQILVLPPTSSRRVVPDRP